MKLFSIIIFISLFSTTSFSGTYPSCGKDFRTSTMIFLKGSAVLPSPMVDLNAMKETLTKDALNTDGYASFLSSCQDQYGTVKTESSNAWFQAIPSYHPQGPGVQFFINMYASCCVALEVVPDIPGIFEFPEGMERFTEGSDFESGMESQSFAP